MSIVDLVDSLRCVSSTDTDRLAVQLVDKDLPVRTIDLNGCRVWLFPSYTTSALCLLHSKSQFYVSYAENLQNIYLNVCEVDFDAWISKKSEQDLKSLATFVYMKLAEVTNGKQALLGTIHNWTSNKPCLYNFYNYKILAA